ncbi:hypothetical protein LSH36_21g10037 [Paralvinella palmiformis]|uniref:Pseudouridine synthase II N-terminal domain-containing protein n=1 Tax=Paralvinella palmiformis TaxID=53620 RepID=A0AAD9KAE2_9ANNE|nr:hypothetical protein LSH36_21g10037 [Paralvinella palmiformis]
MDKYAPTVYRTLNGVFSVYKPFGFTMKESCVSLQVKLAKELNTMKTRPVRERVLIHEENLHSGLPITTTAPDLSDHPLVMAIGEGRRYLKGIARSRYIRTYHVTGQLGIATQDFTPTGRIIQQMTYDHVTHGKMDRVIAAMQASHQKFMFEATGLSRDSQEAYEIASHGLIRPDIKQAGPVVFGMKCIHFEPPEFILEIHSVNEDCTYLRRIVHLLAAGMKTGAVCTQIRRIRYGKFTLAHALLQKHWKSEHILDCIENCRSLVDWNNLSRDLQSNEVNFIKDKGDNETDLEKK